MNRKIVSSYDRFDERTFAAVKRKVIMLLLISIHQVSRELDYTK